MAKAIEPGVNELTLLHRVLRRLARRRRGLRLATALTGAAVGVLWGLAALFLLDWSLGMNVAQRWLALAMLAAVGVWAWRRFVSGWLAGGDTELDLAVLLERQQHIDTDLIAALQFERPEAVHWGSRELEEAVMERAAGISQETHFDEGIPRAPLQRRTAALAVTLLLVAAAVWQIPDYLEVFFRRLALAQAQYPTATVIERVEIDGRTVSGDTSELRCPQGSPIRFEVACSGEIPRQGRIVLEGEKTGQENELVLRPHGELAGRFSATLARMQESSNCQVFLGDARTLPVRLVLVPPPVVETFFQVETPRYAGDRSGAREYRGLRHISVLEGSQVTVGIEADKPLRSAAVTVGDTQYAMTPSGGAEGDNTRWELPPPGTPFARTAEPLHFSVQVVDTDGLSLDLPLQGVIRVRADYPPRVTADALTEVVLPQARPSVAFEAADDFALRAITAEIAILRADGTSETPPPLEIYSADPAAPPRELRDTYRVELSSWELRKGDRLQLTVMAHDFRGTGQPGKSTPAEPIVFRVTDRQGILAAMAQMDRESAEQLEQMIERQLEVGGSL